MEIKVKKDMFFKAISKVQSIIEKRSNMPILSMVLLSTVDKNIHISATDLEISLQQKIPADVIVPGSITISGRKLFEIIKESKSEEICITEKENNWVNISDDHAKYNLACLPAEEYPVFIEPEGVTTIDVNGDILSEMINKTIFAVTMEEAGFKLSGVFTEKVIRQEKEHLRMVSTDGHRLSMVDKEIQNIDKLEMIKGITIPKKGMLELNKMASEGGHDNISLGFKQNNCIARKDDSFIMIRLLESKFPEYRSVIPNNSEVKHHIRVKREDLLDSMKKMVILSNESYKGVRIILDNNDMELISINPDLGDAQDHLKIDYHGERLEMGFNSRYFIDALQVMDSEIVVLSFIDQSRPCLIQGEQDEGFFGLIMPMRI